jgi:hypothetical protein
MAFNESLAVLPQSELSFRAPLMGFHGSEEIVDIVPVLSRMFIACNILGFGIETQFSALVFLHRYALAVAKDIHTQHKSIRGWRWVAAACLFLACKAEEEPRRLRDVINLAHMLFAKEDKGNAATIAENPPDLDEDYWEAKKKIVETEQIVLRWLAFDLSVSHPHRAVFLLLEKEPERDILIPVAFRRLNDALFHAPALKHSVLELTCASIELAEEELKLGNGVSTRRDWCTIYNISCDGIAAAKCRLVEATNRLKQCMEKEDFVCILKR